MLSLEVASGWRWLFRRMWSCPVPKKSHNPTIFLGTAVLDVALLWYLSAVGICVGRPDRLLPRLLPRVCLVCCVVFVGYDLGCWRIGLTFLLVVSPSPRCFHYGECDACVR